MQTMLNYHRRFDSVGGLYDNNMSFLYDGANDYFTSDAGMQAALNAGFSSATAQFTCQFWIKPVALGAVNSLFFQDAAIAGRNFEAYFFDAAGNKKLFFQFVGAAGATFMYWVSNTNFVAGNWYEIKIDYDYSLAAANRAKVWINNVQDVAAWTLGGAFTQIQSIATNYTMGTLFPHASYFNGNIAQFSRWSKVLTAAERLTTYNAGKLIDPRVITGTDLYLPAKNSVFGAQWDTYGLLTGNKLTSSNMVGTELVNTIP